MTNDAAVAWVVVATTEEYGDVILTEYAGTMYDIRKRVMDKAAREGFSGHFVERMASLGWRVEPLVLATAVAELRAEVERLRKYSERLSSELSEMAQVCGEAYQVVGILLDETEQFGSGHGDKILTNLWEGKLIHKDVIPWSFKAARHG